jgi:hypothetical protein
MPDARNAHRQFVSHGFVQSSFGHAETDLAQEGALLLAERLQFDEHTARDIRRTGQADPRAAGGTGMRVQDLHPGDRQSEDLTEPGRLQVVDDGGNTHRPEITRLCRCSDNLS